MSTTDPRQWIKASASDNANQCVEMRRSGAGIEVRDSKNQDGPTLTFAPADFDAWLQGARRGEFDHFVG